MNEPYRAWKHTVNVRAMETLGLAMRFDGVAGRWMYHCHIIEHAERRMKGEVQAHPVGCAR